MLPSTTTVMTLYTFSFCTLVHALISPAPKAFFFFTGDLSLCNKFITEYHFSYKIHSDSQKVLCIVVLQCTHLSCVWTFIFYCFIRSQPPVQSTICCYVFQHFCKSIFQILQIISPLFNEHC